MVAVSELGKGESPELNIASPLEASNESNQLTLGLMQAVLPMVKVTLPEVYCPLASKYRPYHCWKNGIRTNLFDTAIRSDKKVIRKEFEIIVFKDKNGLPKGSERMNSGIFGLPTGGNSYGNRAIV